MFFLRLDPILLIRCLKMNVGMIVRVMDWGALAKIFTISCRKYKASERQTERERESRALLVDKDKFMGDFKREIELKGKEEINRLDSKILHNLACCAKKAVL